MPMVGQRGAWNSMFSPLCQTWVAGSGPAHTPWQVILSQPTRAILSFPPCAFTRYPNHHPALAVHLPVPTTAQKTILTQHLQEDIVKVILAWLLHAEHNRLTHYILSFTHPHVISNIHSWPFWVELVSESIIQTDFVNHINRFNEILD